MPTTLWYSLDESPYQTYYQPADSGQSRGIIGLRFLTASSPSGASGYSFQDTATGPLGTGLSSLQAIWTAVSSPLSASATISGTVSFIGSGSESSMNANYGLRYEVYRQRPDGTRSLIVAANSAELGTTDARVTWTGTPTSTAMEVGDSFLINYGFIDAGGTAAVGFTLQGGRGGLSGGTYESSVTFTETLSFMRPTTPYETTLGTNPLGPPAGTLLYATPAASDLSGTFPGAKSLAFSASASTATYTTTQPAVTYTELPMTDSAGGNTLYFFSPPLSAVTIPVGSLVGMKGVWSPSGVQTSGLWRLFVTDRDGSNAVLIAEYSDWSSATMIIPTVGATIAAGQRLLLRPYIAHGYDAYGGQAGTVTFAAGGAATDYGVTLDVTLSPEPVTYTLLEYLPFEFNIAARPPVAGSAALTNTSSMSVTAVRSAAAAASLTNTSTMSSSPVRTAVAASSLTNASTMVANAVRTAVASAALTSASSLAAAPQAGVTQQGDAALTNTSVMSAAGVRTAAGAASLTNASAIAATAIKTQPAQALLAAATTLAATGGFVLSGVSLLSVASTMAAVAQQWRTGAYPPDTLPVATGVTGTVTNIRDDPDAPDGNALVPSGGAVNVRMTFEGGGRTLRQNTGDQILRVRMKQ